MTTEDRPPEPRPTSRPAMRPVVGATPPVGIPRPTGSFPPKAAGPAPTPPRGAGGGSGGGPPLEAVVAAKVKEEVKAAAEALRTQLASQIDLAHAGLGADLKAHVATEASTLIEQRLSGQAVIDALLPRIREAAAEAVRSALEEARAGIVEDVAKSVLEQLGDGVASSAADRIVPRLADRTDAGELDARIVERAVEGTVEVLKKRRDLDVLMEKLGGEASAKAFAVAREGLDRIVEKLTDRVSKDAVASTLPVVTEKLRAAVASNAIQDQVAKLVAAEIMPELGGVKTDLLAMPEKIAKDAAARANAVMDMRLRDLDLSGIEARVREIASRAALPTGGGTGRLPSAAELEPTIRRYVAEYTIDADNLVKKASEAAVAKAIAAVEPKIPPRVDVEALKIQLYRLIKAELPTVAPTTPASGTALPISEQHFRALAREVKALKDTVADIVSRFEEPAADVPPPPPPPPEAAP